MGLYYVMTCVYYVVPTIILIAISQDANTKLQIIAWVYLVIILTIIPALVVNMPRIMEMYS